MALLLTNNENALEEIFTNLEKLLFRNRTIWVFDERVMASWGRDIYSDEVNVEEINQKILDLIKTPVSNQILIQSMNNLFTYERGNKGFHRWGMLKYFIFAYEEKLKERYREPYDKVSIDDYEFTTIEHILPQEFWCNWSDMVNEFTSEIEEDKKPLAYKVLLNTLGNLTILKDGKNSALGNLGWEDKNNRFSTGSYNEIEISKNAVWTKKEILERGYSMLSFLEEKIDGLKLSDSEKYKLLFYDDHIIASFCAD